MKELRTPQDLASALQASRKQPVFLFKHSTRCSLSSTALSIYRDFIQQNETAADFYFLDLIAHRDLSNQIAEQLNVPHQSPQVLVVCNEKSIWNGSHFTISIPHLLAALKQAASTTFPEPTQK